MNVTTALGVGASLPRKEDARFLHGRGRYVADIRPAGTLEVAFLRSPVAHAGLIGIETPPGSEGAVFVAADLVGVQPIRAVSGLPGFRVSVQPALAAGRVRHVGEAIAACVAATRADAEDLAAACVPELEDLPAVVDMLTAQHDPTRLHDGWAENAFLSTAVGTDLSDLDRGGEGRARTAHRATVHGAVGRPRRARGVGPAARPARRHHIDAAAAHHPHRAGGVPRPR